VLGAVGDVLMRLHEGLTTEEFGAAAAQGWTMVSMQRDWNRIFPA
jgi:hypothetical protein